MDKCRGFVPGYYARWENLVSYFAFEHVTNLYSQYPAKSVNYDTFSILMQRQTAYATVQISKKPVSEMSDNDLFVCTITNQV